MYTLSTRSFVAWIVVLCSVAVLASAHKRTLARLMPGQNVAIEDVPYAVQITDMFGVWLCGGSLVSQQFVVSAANCFGSRFPRELRVIAGAQQRNGGKERKYKISKIIIHPEYRPAVEGNMDVAVLKLAEPVVFSNSIQAIRLCSRPLEANKMLQIVGWGTEDSKNVWSIDVPTLSAADCSKIYKDSSVEITAGMACAGMPTDNYCHGFSGGPAVRMGELCGIVSWGLGCEAKNHPAVYTTIPAVRDFIEKSMLE